MPARSSSLNNSGVTISIRCTLSAQSNSYLATVRLAPTLSATVHLELAHTYTGLGGLADIRCYSFGNSAVARGRQAHDVKIGDLEVVNAG